MEQVETKRESIKEAIAGAIVFFDLLDHPLSAFEIWKNLIFTPGEKVKAVSLGDVQEILDAKEVVGIAEEKGIYFLSGRNNLISSRMKSYVITDGKYRTALKAAEWLRFIPGVRMVAICNSLALGNIKEESDIDFFIITSKNRIWLTRFLVTAVIQLMGNRRYRKNIADRICLSFYISDDSLSLKNITLDTDPYFYYWMASLVPIFDDGCFGRFMEDNLWLKEHLPNFSPIIPSRSRRIDSSALTGIIRRAKGIWFYSFFGGWLENLARSLQLKKMSKNTHSVAEENDSRVVIRDTMLKFHETDRRQEFRDRWQRTMRTLEKKV